MVDAPLDDQDLDLEDLADGADQPWDGPDRRSLDRDQGDRRCGFDRRSGWDRRRGPGKRRSDERRSAEEGEMTDEQFEFLQAVEAYKRANRRQFPSYTEVLEILKALGYRKVAEAQPLNPAAQED